MGNTVLPLVQLENSIAFYLALMSNSTDTNPLHFHNNALSVYPSTLKEGLQCLKDSLSSDPCIKALVPNPQLMLKIQEHLTVFQQHEGSPDDFMKGLRPIAHATLKCLQLFQASLQKYRVCSKDQEHS